MSAAALPNHRLVDLTMPLQNGMQFHPSHFGPSITPYKKLSPQSSAAFSLILNSHSGTHIDAPAHVVEGGTTVDQIELGVLIGPAQIVRLSPESRSLIGPDDLPPIRAPRVLLHTQWSDRRLGQSEYYEAHPILTPEAALRLVEQGVVLVGLDSPSPDYRPGETHRTLLSNGVVIVENLVNLGRAADDTVIAILPLVVDGSDACPVRAVAGLDLLDGGNGARVQDGRS
jgi:kynurenine formamidase